MDSNRLAGNWNDLKGKIKNQWGKLTDDDLDAIDGRVDQLKGTIQKRYGQTTDEAARAVNEWRKKLGN